MPGGPENRSRWCGGRSHGPNGVFQRCERPRVAGAGTPAAAQAGRAAPHLPAPRDRQRHPPCPAHRLCLAHRPPLPLREAALSVQDVHELYSASPTGLAGQVGSRFVSGKRNLGMKQRPRYPCVRRSGGIERSWVVRRDCRGCATPRRCPPRPLRPFPTAIPSFAGRWRWTNGPPNRPLRGGCGIGTVRSWRQARLRTSAGARPAGWPRMPIACGTGPWRCRWSAWTRSACGVAGETASAARALRRAPHRFGSCAVYCWIHSAWMSCRDAVLRPGPHNCCGRADPLLTRLCQPLGGTPS